MKKSQTIASKFFACGIALAALVVALNTSAKTSGEGTAKVVNITGAARVSTGNNIWQPLKAGAILKSGALIQTAAKSEVVLILGDGDAPVKAATGTVTIKRNASSGEAKRNASSGEAKENVVRMTENTLLSIDRLLITKTGADTVTETELDLRSGKIFGSVKKLSGASKYEVKIPNGVAGIRGTVYAMAAGTGVLSVYEGTVYIVYVDPATGAVSEPQPVNAGERFDPATGKITPISQVEIENEIRILILSVIHTGKLPPDVHITPGDPTLYYVSPAQGENGGHYIPPPQ